MDIAHVLSQSAVVKGRGRYWKCCGLWFDDFIRGSSSKMSLYLS